MPSTHPKVRFENVSKAYGRPGSETVLAVDSFSLDVEDGEFVSLLGPSGCGKTTVLNMAAGLLTPTRGTVEIDARPVTGPGRERSYVFQDYALFPWMTVVENVAFGLESYGVPRKAREERALAILDVLNLHKFADAFPNELSGGMKQRVSIARAVAVDPKIILMDEPLAALDAFTRTELQNELLTIWDALKKTILFVTHNIEEATYLSDRIVIMTSHPGRMKTVIQNDLPRPRDVMSSQYHDLLNYVRQQLSEELYAGKGSDYGRLAKVLKGAIG